MEYLQCAGRWLQSRVYLNAIQTTTKRIENEQEYIRFKDLRTREGEPTAKLIREQKRALQRQLEMDDPEAAVDTPWIVAHPDLPGSEDPPQWKALTLAHFNLDVKSTQRLV